MRLTSPIPGAERPREALLTADACRTAVRPFLIALGLAGMAGLLLGGCGARKAPRNPRVAVTVATVERRDMPLALLATGAVEPVETADVGSQVGGVVTRLAIREGQEVAAGQVMIELDARPFRAAYEQARAVLARDLAQYSSARGDAERADRMVEQNLISPSEHDKTVSTAEALHAAVRADSATVANARLNLEYASIRAPISGRAGALHVNVGDLVKAATSEPLVTINRMRPIRVRFTVSESELPLVQRYRSADPRVWVRAAAGDSVEIEGRLVFVDNTVDPATGTLLLKGEFANRDGRLWPGEFVEVRMVLTTQKGALVVPAPAVSNGQQGTYVVVLNRDSTTTSRPVQVTSSDDVTAVIAAGLEPGETVITDGQFRISPGAKVMVRAGAGGARP